MNDRTLAQQFAFVLRGRVPARGHRRVHPGHHTNLYEGLDFAGDDGTAELLGLFQVSILHNIVHMLFGVGILMAATHEGALNYLLGAGVLYVALFLIGIIGGGDWIPVNSAEQRPAARAIGGLLGAGRSRETGATGAWRPV